MNYKKITLLLILQIIVCLSSPAQNSIQYHGSPLIRNYLPDEYGDDAQVWAITQDKRGVMYFGFAMGMLEYDGVSWRKHRVANNSVIRSLEIDANGVIYVGASNEFGYFIADNTGNLVYNSLSQFLPDSALNFQDVWKTFVTSHGVYFVARTRIFRWYNNKLDYFSIELEPFFAFKINDNIYIKEQDKPPALLQNFKTKELKNCGLLKSDNGYIFINDLSDNKLLFSTREKGSYTYNTKTGELIKRNIHPSINQYFKENLLFTVRFLDNNRIAYSTLHEGIIITDKSGNLIQVVNKPRGMASNCVYALFFDKDKNLWAGTQNGISRIDLSYPVIRYDDKQGIEDFVLGFIRHEGVQYVNTSNQLFYLPDYTLSIHNDNHFLKVISGVSYCWDLKVIKGKLLAGSNTDLMLIENKKAKQLFKLDGIILNIGYSEKYPDKIFFGLNNGLNIANVTYDTNRRSIEISNLFRVRNITEQIRDIVFGRDNTLWLSSSSEGVVLVRFHNDSLNDYTVTKFRRNKNGLPGDIARLSIAKVNNQINIFTHKGVYKPVFPQAGMPDSLIEFEHNKFWGRTFTQDSAQLSYAIPIDKEKYLIRTGAKSGILIKKEDTIIHNFAPFNRINRIYGTFIAEGKYANFGTPEAYYIYDLEKEKNYKKPFKVIIRRVKTTADSIIFDGMYYTDKDVFKIEINQPERFKPVLEYKNNTLKVEFSSTFYEDAEKTTYQYMIENFDKTWSHWSTETNATYTNIPEGNYVFKVKAQNIYNNISDITCYEFSVLPPWYRTWWAYLCYFIGSVIFILLIIRLNSKRLKDANIKLEQTIKERTIEIVEKNEELRQQKEEIQSQAEELEKNNRELEKLSIVASETDNVVIIINKNAEIEWVNEGFTRLFGYSLDEYKKIYATLYEGSQKDNIKDIVKKCIESGKTDTYESFNKTKAGEDLWMQTTITPILDSNKNVSKLILIESDITKIKQAEAEITKQNQQLAKLNATKDKFFSIIAHDLKSPFSGIMGLTELLLRNVRKYEIEKIEKYTSHIHRSADEAYKLLQNLLEWSRSQTGRLDFNPHEIILSELLDKVFDIVNNQAISKEISIDTDINKKLIVFADENMLNTILRNLISNAIKFTNRKGIISISAQKREHDVLIKVSDNGIGMEEEIRIKLFKISEKVSVQGTENEKGTGLGLLLCKEFIEKHHGDIWVESEEDKGSTFFFTLPNESQSTT